MAVMSRLRTRVVALTRQRMFGLIYVGLGLLSLVLFLQDTTSDELSTLGVNTTNSVQLVKLPDIVVPVQLAVWILSILVIALGIYQIVRQPGRTGWLLGLVSLVFIGAFLVWAARGTSFSLIGILAATLTLATPILLGALSGILCERSGVVNIAIEGIMLGSAMISVLVANLTGSILLGFVAGLLLGGLFGAWHAVMSIRFKMDQIISGTVINIFATGLT